jgi:hypothetical protein
LTIMDFGGPLLVFEVIGLVQREGLDGKKYPQNVGNEFYLEQGMIKEVRENGKTTPKFFPKGSNKGEDLAPGAVEIGEGGHFENFIHGMRTRKIEDLNADIGVGYLSATCCHLGNISYRLGSQVTGSTKPDILGKNEVVAKSWETVLETVKGAIGLDVAKGTYQLGPMLTFDPKTEKFVGSEQANQLLTRSYRKPFVVPEQV